MSQHLVAEIRTVARTVWTSLGLDAEVVDAPAPMDATQLVGCVQISGDWVGGVQVACPLTLARGAAAAMTMMPVAEVADDILRDAFGEIVNMIGGGVKTALGGSLALSLPLVVEGREFTMSIRNAAPRDRVHLRSAGEVLTVTLFAQER